MCYPETQLSVTYFNKCFNEKFVQQVKIWLLNLGIKKEFQEVEITSTQCKF